MGTIKDYVSTVTTNDVILNNGIRLNAVLRRAAQDLVAAISDGISQFYASYSPSIYQRTGGLYRCMTDGGIGAVVIHGDTATITVQIQKDEKTSLWGGASIDAFWLMNSGYSVSTGWHKNIPYFGFRTGAHYIEDAVSQIQTKYAYIGLTVEIETPSW